MELEKEETPAIQLDVKQLKEILDIYIVTCQNYMQRFTFYYEEFEQVHKMVSFYKALIADYKAKIEALEPKAEQDGQAKDA